jgi:hypothetical protein
MTCGHDSGRNDWPYRGAGDPKVEVEAEAEEDAIQLRGGSKSGIWEWWFEVVFDYHGMGCTEDQVETFELNGHSELPAVFSSEQQSVDPHW